MPHQELVKREYAAVNLSVSQSYFGNGDIETVISLVAVTTIERHQHIVTATAKSAVCSTMLMLLRHISPFARDEINAQFGQSSMR